MDNAVLGSSYCSCGGSERCTLCYGTGIREERTASRRLPPDNLNSTKNSKSERPKDFGSDFEFSLCQLCSRRYPSGREQEHLRTFHPEQRPAPTRKVPSPLNPVTSLKSEWMRCPACNASVLSKHLKRHWKRLHSPERVQVQAATPKTTPSSKQLTRCLHCLSLVPINEFSKHLSKEHHSLLATGKLHEIYQAQKAPKPRPPHQNKPLSPSSRTTVSDRLIFCPFCREPMKPSRLSTHLAVRHPNEGPSPDTPPKPSKLRESKSVPKAQSNHAHWSDKKRLPGSHLDSRGPHGRWTSAPEFDDHGDEAFPD